ncbi:chloride channel protein, CIC family [Malonomonas rubra DSM 5091]|uniref:Chloride channel protein, CIC family n=1 Tax=Malonomonas rubra DSM 5091 TaxID=1122189 RepID=A0A1M6I054_MALRU|nr:chloride channel protein [Malonomonas rubra]SHJ27770.1 chloride channel protein, CIC family [Malonomonas rubra DSM 5091]
MPTPKNQQHEERSRPRTTSFSLLNGFISQLLNRFKISDNTFLIVLAVIIGLLGGLGNYLFRKTIELVHWLVFEQGLEFFDISLAYWTPQRFLVMFFPVAAALMLIPLWAFFGKDLKGGFSGFLVKVNLKGAKLPLRPIFTRGFGSAITLGAGGSAGQEGPIAAIGGAIGSQFGQLFKVSGDRLKVLVACGAAAGVAATFNAPIAGVFFATEIVLLSSFELASFTSIVIASGMATVVSRALLGNHSELIAPPYFVGNFWEIGLYLLLGLIIGGLAAGFIDLHMRIKGKIEGIKLHKFAKLLLGGLAVGIIGMMFPQVFGNGYEFMSSVLSGHHAWYLLAGLVVIKMLATSITLGSGMPGGLFAPCLFLGAVAGGAFGKLVAFALPAAGLSAGAYALVGMGAFLAAATHAPMTAIFLLFEITDSYEVIIPIMLTCVIGTSIARHLKNDSLETAELSKLGIDLEAGKERNIMKALAVGDVMSRRVETVPESMTLGNFAKFIEQTHHTNFPLVDELGELTGIISVQDFMGVVFEKDLMDLVVIKELATTEVVTVHPEEDLDTAMRKIGYRNIEQLPVVDRETHRKLYGIISRRDMITAYNRALMARNLGEDE